MLPTSFPEAHQILFLHPVLSPPPSLADFGNVFDFDLNASLPNEMQASSSSSQHWLQIPGQYPHSSSRQAFSNSPCPSPVQSSANTEGSETARQSHSREPSPNQSDNDQNNPRRRYPCLILGCTRRFTSQYTLKVHMEAHKPKPRVSFPCTLGCSEKFSRQHDRLRHEVAKHGKVCEFSCEECGRFFSTKKTLGNHKCPVAQGTRWVDT
ncbi:Transcriptional regulator prz1 [Leucoagaricus sp. SymC.cos]|nr:Transcriptional regulator prz1 [Leucoagaricus sp. SymC.cos]